MSRKIFYRPLQIFILTLTSFVLIYSYYMEYVLNLEPCLLCITQRFCLMGLLAGSILICSINQKKIKWVLVVQIVLALAGLVFASRQLWLQSLHGDQLPACLPGFNALIHYFPWQTAARGMLWGSASCAEISWRWLGLSIAGWSAIYFFFMLTVQFFSLYFARAQYEGI